MITRTYKRADAGLIDAYSAAGSLRKLAEKLGLTAASLSFWVRVPVGRVLDVERLTGVSRYRLRPDIYGAAPDIERKAS